ncbi:hypothetical protein AVEN_261515-1 [Araneus ventricosus]|uniref:Uncharacterized protein n=1 Tax=Araneus ventricosus TaxID=182803 RepID=A0A4Y2SQZ2_ARAVE|nr:hypothetical protein AVEN_261515-1 [Araneus ventricosus]
MNIKIHPLQLPIQDHDSHTSPANVASILMNVKPSTMPEAASPNLCRVKHFQSSVNPLTIPLPLHPVSIECVFKRCVSKRPSLVCTEIFSATVADENVPLVSRAFDTNCRLLD